MSYPSGPPGNSGYPPAQQQTNPFAAQTQQFGKPEPGVDAPNKLPTYLAAVVAVLGIAVYLSSFAPLFTISASDFPGLGSISGSSFGLVLAVGAALLAGLLAAASLLPRQTVSTAVYAVLSVVAFLLVIAEVINKPGQAAIDWGLYLIIAFSLFQAIVAVAVLLFESGIISPPAPRPKYDQPYGQQYGAPGPYYGQPGQIQGGYGGPQQQRPGYPSTYPGTYPGGPSTGGHQAPQQQGQPGQQGQQGQPGQQGQGGQQTGPPTPPTGFPTYGQPPSGSSPTTQQAQPSSSSQSGQSTS
ncbi:DUF5336 domain-containing protein [Mycolicibacterium flavescens]|uniref:34 kDa antigenic protein n=1 Tax=Mycolicibacterium flavescens TaxID=1776 RepID=A0A1E3RE79_MYCFV|nr:DUF5336 domain-containing protein [Mycolicibacterium flavescens]MCV7282729.1 DUF5336 domain-containing protein [Mycolicibacterium flavescens]ODQ88163.1 hypothetical protein BHQ18_20130 [Mycolicibacterium flavescens]